MALTAYHLDWEAIYAVSWAYAFIINVERQENDKTLPTLISSISSVSCEVSWPFSLIESSAELRVELANARK